MSNRGHAWTEDRCPTANLGCLSHTGIFRCSQCPCVYIAWTKSRRVYYPAGISGAGKQKQPRCADLRAKVKP